jgi:hypothetical protein
LPSSSQDETGQALPTLRTPGSFNGPVRQTNQPIQVCIPTTNQQLPHIIKSEPGKARQDRAHETEGEEASSSDTNHCKQSELLATEGDKASSSDTKPETSTKTTLLAPARLPAPAASSLHHSGDAAEHFPMMMLPARSQMMPMMTLPARRASSVLPEGGGVSRSGASVGRQDELAAARNEEVDLMQRRHALRCKQVGRDCPAKPETRNPKHQRRDG